MNSKQYDIAIIGGSLTARIAAALLAKQGSKVLFIRNREAKAPAWFHSSIFLEHLLGVLGGRSCFTDQRPIQVISEHTRLILSNDIPLEDELQREFGKEATNVLQWLNELQKCGEKLEELFWENGGLPWSSFKATASFKMLCMRRNINLAELEQPIKASLRDFSEPIRVFLTDLLQGLSLTRISGLSRAKAAMLWAQALRPENLVEPDFSVLLKKRFEQFHGAKASLDEVASLDYDGTDWTGGLFKSGTQFSARYFLLGDKRWADMFKAGNINLPNPSRTPKAFKTSDLKGQLSKLLENRIISGGALPLRIALDETDKKINGLALSTQDASKDEVRRQLETIFPFASYDLEEVNTDEPAAQDASQTTALSNLPIRIKGNLFCADRTLLLPEMGAAGAALLAWTLTKNLGKGSTEAKV